MGCVYVLVSNGHLVTIFVMFLGVPISGHPDLGITNESPMFSALAGMALYLEKQQLCQHHG
jgi:hypothetical protein